jgi:hypothetical protein
MTGITLVPLVLSRTTMKMDRQDGVETVQNVQNPKSLTQMGGSKLEIWVWT